MRTRAKDGVNFAVAAALLFAGCRSDPGFDARRRGELAEEIVAGWPEPSRLAARKMIGQYGPPDALADDGLGWTRRGPWKRIIVRDEGDILRQTVSYRLPESKRAALAELAGGVSASAEGDELSVRSGDEKTNFLALNLADEVLRGARSPGDARRFYGLALRLDAAGKTSPYLYGLRFPAGE